jgi:competence CoiA-like predicted nuclease
MSVHQTGGREPRGFIMARSHQAEPRWVLVNDTLCNVSEFANLSPARRPTAICPVCKESVILKLGHKNAHHYAHRFDNRCASANHETALHLNTKFYIYNQLLRPRVLIVEESCAGCGAKRTCEWAQGWDDIKVEYTVDSYRPDIALIYNNDKLRVIEVFVTHEVDEEKAKHFSDQGISWLEIQANEDLYTGESPWTSEKPLPYRRLYPYHKNWRCDACLAHEKEQVERRDFLLKNSESIYSAKMVDFYFKSGKKLREVFFAVKKIRNGEWVEAWIETEKGRIIALEKAPITEGSRMRLNNVVKNHINEFRAKGAIVDEFMKWRPWEQGKKFVARDIERFPFRYWWHGAKKEWLLL